MLGEKNLVMWLYKRVCVCTVLPLGRTFQAIVSVMAVKIQLSSPRGVRLSLSLPGILHHTHKHTQTHKTLHRWHCVSHAHCIAHSWLRAQSGNCSVTLSQHVKTFTVTYSARLTATAGLNIPEYTFVHKDTGGQAEYQAPAETKSKIMDFMSYRLISG